MEVTTDPEPVLAMQTGRGAQVRKAKIKLYKVVEVMGWKAVGNKLTDFAKSDQMEWVKPMGPVSQASLFPEEEA